MPITLARARRAASPACAPAARRPGRRSGPASPPQMSRISRGDALDVLDRRRRIDAALEAVAGVGREVVAARAARRPPRATRTPPRRRRCVVVVRHRGRVAAHDAGERSTRRVVGDHADRRVDLDRVCRSAASASRPSRPQRTSRPPWILSRSKTCERPAELEHHVVRDVDQRARRSAGRSAPGARTIQRGVGAARIDVADDAAREAAAADRAPRSRTGSAPSAARTGTVRERRRLAAARRSAPTTSRATPRTLRQSAEVRRQLEREHRVVERRAPRAHRRRPRASRRARASPRGRRTARARAPSTACRWLSTPRSLPSLISKARRPPRRRQLGADQRARRLHAGAHVRRAADDLRAARRAGIDLAHAQPVGVRMALDSTAPRRRPRR